MKKFSLVITCLLVPLILLHFIQNVLAAPNNEPNNSTDAEEVCLGQNLLANPSFEGQYSAYDPPHGHEDCIYGVCNSAQMADGWTPWWRSHNDSDPGHIIRMPEYKPDILADHWTGPVRTRSGERAQQYFSFFSTHEAGFYQQVTAVPGADYCFSVWGHSWSAQDDGDALSGPEEGVLRQKVGIDPTGGTNWQSPNIIWSDQRHANGRVQSDIYDLFSVTAEAQAETITLFTYSQPDYAVKHNNVYWDDAALTAAAELLISPATGLDILTAPTATVKLSQTISISYTGTSTLTWSAVLAPGNTLTPTLTPSSGGGGHNLTITLDSANLPLGHYTAEVIITTNPSIQETPTQIPYQIIIVPEVKKIYLPLSPNLVSE